VRGRIGEARIAVEATPGAQADEDLPRAPLQCPLQFDGVVTCVEDEQWGGLSFFKPTQQSANLLGGDHVGVLGRPDTLHVHGGGPALAGEVELRDELVGPSGHDGLAGGVAGRVVVEAALWAALGVAARPHAHVHGVDGRWSASGERMASEQPSQGFVLDPSPPECGVEAAPAATMRCLEAQVDGRRSGDAVGGEDGVGEFEEGVGSATEPFVVERAAEGLESVVVRFHDVSIMHSPGIFRILPRLGS
jgi:hypothetical protein